MKKVELANLKVGGKVQIVINGVVEKVDLEDSSVLVAKADGGSTWLYPSHYGATEILTEDPPLVPHDAELVSVEIGNKREVFIRKRPDGTWIDSDSEEYDSANVLAWEIVEWGAAESLRVWKRADQ
ncbi:hypothetical protein ISF9_054 [Microbacterium phage vB_MoxS-ISF9]|uniref:Uncharacterized protein n=1 Tax=Microbacterium phage vB_MoxS-ISF9 TaxID=1458670 RepID=W8NNY3_9CAUD|nr:hypothetical protein ISF9_054 [Microbacterium phage vB_MoxS-ISF9]AHL18524.1 hypothetical protein ISF9_054 [Microbacterium phage vB_MoxS-ISF9]